MAEETSDDLCEEPDADFFDTFFDDGVLETIGEVLGSRQPCPVSEDPSCQPLDTTPDKFSTRHEQLVPRPQNHLKNTSTPKQTENCTHKEVVIVLKSANIKDFNHSLKNEDLKCASGSRNSSELVNEGLCISKASSDVETKGKLLDSASEFEGSGGSFIVSSSTPTALDFSPYQKDCNYSSMDELLAKVQKFLKETPTIEDGNAQSPSKGSSSSKLQNLDNTKDMMLDKPDVQLRTGLKHTQECAKVASTEQCETYVTQLDHSSVLHSRNDSKANSKRQKEFEPSKNHKSSHDIGSISKETSGTCEEGELIEDVISSHDLFLGPKESAIVARAVQDETEKENDLTLEENCPKKKSSESFTGQKISFNLKTQILASTSIFNSGSPEKSDQSSIVLRKQKTEHISPTSRLLPKEQSPTSDNSTSGEKALGKRHREISTTRTSITPDQENSKLSSRELKKKKNKRKGEKSPTSRRGNGFKKKKKTKRKRSRSRSTSPHLTSWRPTKRDRSPLYDSRRKRRRSASRSPPPLSSQRYSRRLSRSPLRRRSKSRSHSPFPRVRKSPSPGSRRRRASRSKSRSPFINEICRLKKQWEKEDQEKRNSFHYAQHLSALPHTHFPAIQHWPNEGQCTSTRMVSNLVSVSVESVQVRSASYTFDNNAEKQCYEAGHIPGCSMPTQVSSPFMPPGYQNCNNGLSYGTPMPITVLPIAPQPYHPRNALNESEPNSCCVPQQVSLLSPQPAPAPANVAEHQTSVLRKQLDILRSTVVSLPEPRSSGNLEPSRTKTAHQTSAQTKCKPIETQDLRMSEVVYEKIHNPSPTQLSEPNFTGSSNGILPCAMSNSSNRIVDKMTSSALASGISSTEINSGSMRRNDRLPPNQLSTPTCSEQLNGAGCIPINNDVCSTSLSKPKEIPNEKKSQDAQSAPSLQLHSSPNIPVVGEINFNLSDKPCQNPQIGEIEVVNVSVDDYDSDIIIDEAPLKPPVELICLSGDEAEIDSQDDLKHEFDLINMGLDPITHSTESTEVAPVEPSTNPNQLDAEKIKQKSKRKKSKKSSENRKKRRRNIRRKASIEQVGTTSSSGNTFDDSSILKECHEMIDSLRIGRFVVVDDDSESHTEKEEEKSTSVIWKTKKVVFSYTQQSKPEEVPRIKTASTNTPIRLYIDVCTGTESFVLSKDCVIQTELGCEKCLEKENLIREMKEQLYSLRKERDDLNAMVCNYNKIPAIPGLDLPSGEAKLPSGLHAESVPIVLPYKELSHWPCEVHKNTVTTNTPMKDVRVSLETANAVNTHVQNEQTEPIISYEYNHL